MDESRLQAYGRCPLGHNLSPSDDTGDNLSTNLIDEGEEQPLFWSNYHQKYICNFCLRRVDDLKDDKKFHENQIKFEKTLQGMGFVRE